MSQAESSPQAGRPGDVDYAEPVSLPSSRSRSVRARPVVRLWGGRGRRRLTAACTALGLVLATVLVVALLRDRPGASSPQAAVSQLVQGIADLDGPAIVGVVAPAEVADAGRADAAYARLEGRVVRVGEVPPVEVDRVLAAATDQLSGSSSPASVAVLAAVDLDLSGLDLEVVPIDARTARVLLVGGDLGVRVDPGRLPDEAAVEGAGPGAAVYEMALAEGWQRDGVDLDAYLVTVEVDGRWYVSLEATADDLLGTS